MNFGEAVSGLVDHQSSLHRTALNRVHGARTRGIEQGLSLAATEGGFLEGDIIIDRALNNDEFACGTDDGVGAILVNLARLPEVPISCANHRFWPSESQSPDSLHLDSPRKA